MDSWSEGAVDRDKISSRRTYRTGADISDRVAKRNGLGIQKNSWTSS